MFDDNVIEGAKYWNRVNSSPSFDPDSPILFSFVMARNSFNEELTFCEFAELVLKGG